MTTRSNPCQTTGIMTPNEVGKSLGLGPMVEPRLGINHSAVEHMEPLLCKCCYGTINPVTMTCDYCGTRHISNNMNYGINVAYDIDGKAIASFMKRQLDEVYHRESLYEHALKALRG